MHKEICYNESSPHNNTMNPEYMTIKELVAELEAFTLSPQQQLLDLNIRTKRASIERLLYLKHFKKVNLIGLLRPPLGNFQTLEINHLTQLSCFHETTNNARIDNTLYGIYGVLPQMPRVDRCDNVHALQRPPGCPFFMKMTCNCIECNHSIDREWDILNGMKCNMVLPLDSIPEQRSHRRIILKDKDYISPLVRRITASNSFEDIFFPNYSCHSQQSLAPIPLPGRRLRGSADWRAEVIVIVTSLRTYRRQHYDSLKICHLFKCKGVEFFSIDINDDAATEHLDKTLISTWCNANWIHKDPHKYSTENKDILVPQIIIDGVPIGSFIELQQLEDEHDLDYILSQEICPNCLYNRVKPIIDNQTYPFSQNYSDIHIHEQSNYCFFCGAVFKELLDSHSLPGELLDYLVKRSFYSLQTISPLYTIGTHSAPTISKIK